MKTTPGFTVVESLAAIVFLGIVGTVFFDIYRSLNMTHRDQDRKVAINTIHYRLEEVVRPKLGGYPRVLSASQLSSTNRDLFKDPAGVAVGQPTSDYRYEPTGCNGGDICSGYVLRADLERESDFIKSHSTN